MRLLTLLLLAGCVRSIAYQAPVIRAKLPSDKAAVTVCAENNLPFVAIDSASQGTVLDLSYGVHEDKHVQQARRTRGGCRAFVLKYNTDSAFRRRTEWEAYCAQGRWLIAHGSDPVAIWRYISGSMRANHGETVFKNCLYEEGGSSGGFGRTLLTSSPLAHTLVDFTSALPTRASASSDDQVVAVERMAPGTVGLLCVRNTQRTSLNTRIMGASTRLRANPTGARPAYRFGTTIVHVVGSERMALRTCRPPCVDRMWRETAHGVHHGCDRLKMPRIATRLVTTQVIDHKPGRNGTHDALVRQPVGAYTASAIEQPAVALGELAWEIPTPGLVPLVVKPLQKVFLSHARNIHNDNALGNTRSGRFAVRRNRNPEAVWDYIVNAMALDSILTSKNNCLFEPWPEGR